MMPMFHGTGWWWVSISKADIVLTEGLGRKQVSPNVLWPEITVSHFVTQMTVLTYEKN